MIPINELRELAQDVGMAVAPASNGYWDNSKQLSDFANAIEARTKENCIVACEHLHGAANRIRAMP